MRTLVVTNDFPPRTGGIEAFVHGLCQRLDPDQVVVYTTTMPGDREFDRSLPFPVIRDGRAPLVPSPTTTKRAIDVLRAEGCDRVLFGSAAPLALMARDLRNAGAHRIVALTHGHETSWAGVPVGRHAIRRIGRITDVLTFVGEYTRTRIARALHPRDAAAMVRLRPGVDTDTFRRDVGGAALRARLGLGVEQPVVVSVGRLVGRKGHDVLVRAWPHVLRRVPDAVLLLVGDGPRRSALEAVVAETGVQRSVRLVGAVPWSRIPPWFDAADVFAMPCRTRLGGLEAEALGIVFLEAQACEVPVIVGDSGGAPETVLHGETGFVVDPYNPVAVAAKIIAVLGDPERARAMGKRARSRVQEAWTWERSTATLRRLLYL